jgi:uncharacterized membrane protein YkvA (DUF1232 family)
MPDRKDLTIPSKGGFLSDFLMRIKLIWRLMRDGRVSPWLKVIPLIGLLYFVVPIDLISEIALPLVGEVDDVAVLWLTNYVFLELCPPEIVRQHLRDLAPHETDSDGDDVVDADAVEIKETKG